MRLRRDGYAIDRGVWPVDACALLVQAVLRYAAAQDLPLIERRARGRPLRYHVVDGHAIRRALPDVRALASRLQTIAEALWGGALSPWGDERVAVNVNITPAGGAYRWHYDRNPVTLILYLNHVRGGEIELYPRYRLRWRRPGGAAQQALDRALALRPVRALFGRHVVVAPEPGLLVAMRGDRCLHSVRPVEGGEPRVALVASYAEPGAATTENAALDSYLYTAASTAGRRDPNYR